MFSSTTQMALSALVLTVASAVVAHGSPVATAVPNRTSTSLGMEFVKVPKGSFRMGFVEALLPSSLTRPIGNFPQGDADEHPAHTVTLSNDFLAQTTEVTNAQYEAFDPDHRAHHVYARRPGDNEAVVYVSHQNATDFAAFLSAKEGRNFRLPTEAEWEYMARAHTTTWFSTGKTVPDVYQKHQTEVEDADATIKVNLTVGQTPPNAFRLHDVVGNVEEWCADWFGPYPGSEQRDPIGPADGDFRVTRGGSHSTYLYYLRSSNRAGGLPQDKSLYIGFRLVEAPPLPVAQQTPPHSVPEPRPAEAAANRQAATTTAPTASGSPTGFSYLHYVKPANGSMKCPFAHHNHDSALMALPDGSLFAIWYSTIAEPGRMLCAAYSTLAAGGDSWADARVFWDVPDRNDHAPALLYDSKNKQLVHFEGLSSAATWGNLATIMRKSSDGGKTWTRAEIIFPTHGLHHMPVETAIVLANGTWLLPTDAVTGGSGYTVVHLSTDNGETWLDHGDGRGDVKTGNAVLGIHGAVVELRNGSFFAFGRGNDLPGRCAGGSCLAQSLSNDHGITWHHSASEFPGIHGGQRETLLRLSQGPIMMTGFANVDLPVIDASNKTRFVRGLYSALSFDEGNSWSHHRILSDDSKGHEVVGFDLRLFNMSFSTAEPDGYCSLRQAPDGTVHVLSSRIHYAMTYEWLTTPPPSQPVE
eukprot:m.48197 g.48197  ORF g.48197 m.48197 type:complete len:697 (+) comp11979_c0_seq1:470-2560(+)